jgi:hypothetical protein
MSIRGRSVLFALVLAVLGAGQAARAAEVFYTDFETGLPLQFSGAGSVQGTQNYPSQAPAFGSWFLRNSTFGTGLAATALTITNLPAHTSIDLNFLLAVIDSWDGTPNDYFNVSVDGSTVFSSSFSNFNIDDRQGGSIVTFSHDLFHDTSLDPPGPGYVPYADSAFTIALSVPHTSSAVTIDFFANGPGWQGGADESWAIDDIFVGASTPEPGAWELMLSGLGVIVASRFRRIGNARAEGKPSGSLR